MYTLSKAIYGSNTIPTEIKWHFVRKFNPKIYMDLLIQKTLNNQCNLEILKENSDNNSSSF